MPGRGPISALPIAGMATAGTNGNATGAIGTVTCTAPSATAAGNAQASGAVGTIQATAPMATAAGAATASGAIGTVTMYAPAGTATAGVDGAAIGSLGTITVIPSQGSAIGVAGPERRRRVFLIGPSARRASPQPAPRAIVLARTFRAMVPP